MCYWVIYTEACVHMRGRRQRRCERSMHAKLCLSILGERDAATINTTAKPVCFDCDMAFMREHKKKLEAAEARQRLEEQPLLAYTDEQLPEYSKEPKDGSATKKY